MRIVTKGKIPPPKKWRIICWNCASELEFTNDDVSYPATTNYTRYVICPLCKAKLTGLDNAKLVED